MKVIIHTDGGSRGNPGPAAAGFVLEDIDGRRLLAKAFFLGETTNNVAEYTALIKALEAALKLGTRHATVHTHRHAASSARVVLSSGHPGALSFSGVRKHADK